MNGEGWPDVQARLLLVDEESYAIPDTAREVPVQAGLPKSPTTLPTPAREL